MIKPAIALWLTLLSLYVAPSSQAEPLLSAVAPGAGGAAKSSSKEVVQQKLMLVKMTLSKSSAVDRATKSSDPTLSKQGADVLDLYAKANNAFNGGDFAGAEKMLDQVLNMVSDISKQAPDPARLEAEQKARYTELLDSVKGIQVTYQEMRKEMSSKDKNSSVVDVNLERTSVLLKQAQTLASSSRLKEAIFLLDNAYTSGVADLNKIMGSEVKSYEATFKTPADEYKHEVSRYKSFEELIPVAHEQLKPSEAILKMTDRVVQESKNMRDTAKQQAASGDYASAIAGLQEATKRLQNALRTMGLTLPE